MKIILDVDKEQNFIDLWNHEKNKWERYIKCEEEDKKIEKLDTKDLFTCDDYQNIRLNFGLTWSKINEIIDKLEEK